MYKPSNMIIHLTMSRRWLTAAFIANFSLCLGCQVTFSQVRAQHSEKNRAIVVQPAEAARPSGGVTIAQTPAQTAAETAAQKYFTDVVLLNQNGERMRFYSDLLQGKVVVINSFFATCQGSCLPMNRNLEKLQRSLSDHVGNDVYILSISVDPTVDTPASLKEYAKKLNARPGWYFLTGDKQNIDFALKKLGLFVSAKEDHLNIFIIGNERTGLWKKHLGWPQAMSWEKLWKACSTTNHRSESDIAFADE